MDRINEHLNSDLIDLGAASVETKGIPNHVGEDRGDLRRHGVRRTGQDRPNEDFKVPVRAAPVSFPLRTKILAGNAGGLVLALARPRERSSPDRAETPIGGSVGAQRR
jgi:hypothetical protein